MGALNYEDMKHLLYFMDFGELETFGNSCGNNWASENFKQKCFGLKKLVQKFMLLFF